MQAWDSKAAMGLAQGESHIDEAIEKTWAEQWLFFGNSTRFSSAMAGADYGVFANGRWYMAKNIQELWDRLKSVVQRKE
jgi:hydroxylamine dehydrogenase